MDPDKRSERRMNFLDIKLTYDIVELAKKWNKVRDVVFVTDLELWDSSELNSNSTLASFVWDMSRFGKVATERC
jgi:hypothetical protein